MSQKPKITVKCKLRQAAQLCKSRAKYGECQNGTAIRDSKQFLPNNLMHPLLLLGLLQIVFCLPTVEFITNSTDTPLIPKILLSNCNNTCLANTACMNNECVVLVQKLDSLNTTICVSLGQQDCLENSCSSSSACPSNFKCADQQCVIDGIRGDVNMVVHRVSFAMLLGILIPILILIFVLFLLCKCLC